MPGAPSVESRLTELHAPEVQLSVVRRLETSSLASNSTALWSSPKSAFSGLGRRDLSRTTEASWSCATSLTSKDPNWP